uniref:hypothetical protein n=1 Tax=Catenibacterium sp. TaxID=2049022 RepID=UPI0030795276
MSYAIGQFESDPNYKGGLIIAENGEIVSGQRMGEIFKKGLTDREELNIASLNLREDRIDFNATNKKEELIIKVEVSDIPDQKYTGKAIEPEVKITVNSQELIFNKDSPFAVGSAADNEIGNIDLPRDFNEVSDDAVEYANKDISLAL